MPLHARNKRDKFYQKTSRQTANLDKYIIFKKLVKKKMCKNFKYDYFLNEIGKNIYI